MTRDKTFEEHQEERKGRRGGSRGRRNSGRSRGRDSGRGGRDRRSRDKPEMTTVTCSDCGKECKVPFKPTSSKPVYCSDCFEKRGNGNKGVNLSEIHEKLDKIMKALKIE